MSETKFNGVSLFGTGASAVFGGNTIQDVTVSIFTSATGESGSLVSINKSMLLSALTVNSNTLKSASHTVATNLGVAGACSKLTFAASTSGGTMTLDKVSVAVFTQALETLQLFVLRTEVPLSRLQFSRKVLQLNELI